MKRIYSVLVENRFGVLSKVASLFARRSFNIESLAVGETEDPSISCITIVSSGDERILNQIEKQLNKILDVIKVKTFSQEESTPRELALIKVRYNRNTRKDILEICDTVGARIVDISKKQMTLQLCEIPERIQLLIHMLQPIGIVEVARTGTLALAKCQEE